MAQTTSAEELPAAEVAARFTIYPNDVLGRGGFGEVLRGLDNATGRFVAVKQVRALDQLAGPQTEALLSECRLLSSLPPHPNVVAMIASSISDGVARVFLEWVPGGSVHSMLSRARFRLHEGTVRRLVKDALEGLAFLHDHSVVHRDIKPANLLVDGDGRVKLADFGTSKLLQCAGGAGASATLTTSLQGTVRFMAPEVMRGRPGPAADIWALGCSALCLLTNTLPWADRFPPASLDSDLPVIFFIGSLQPPDHMPEVPSHVSEAMRGILVACFAFDPAERATARTLLSNEYFTTMTDVPDDAETIDAYHAACDAASAHAPGDDTEIVEISVGFAMPTATLMTGTGGLVGVAPTENSSAATSSEGALTAATIATTSSTGSQKSVRAAMLLRGVSAFFATVALGTKNSLTSLGATVTSDMSRALILFPGGECRSPRAVALFTRLLAIDADNPDPPAVAALLGADFCRSKCEFARALRTMSQFFGHDVFDGMGPKTWCLPGDKAALDGHLEAVPSSQPRVSRGSATGKVINAKAVHAAFIVKPDEGAGGDGVYVTADPSKPRHGTCVVQEYLATPLLLGGLKCDFRVYVTIVRAFPTPVVYVHREGLARVAVIEFQPPSRGNMSVAGMHLTNCSINRHNNAFVPNESADKDTQSSRRRLSTALGQLEAEHGAGRFSAASFFDQVDAMAQRVAAMVVLRSLGTLGEDPSKSLLATRGFQLLALDVLPMRSGACKLLEVSDFPVASPGEEPVDDAVKTGAMQTCVVAAAMELGLGARFAAHGQSVDGGQEASAEMWPSIGVPAPHAVDGRGMMATFVEPFLPLLAIFNDFCGTPGRRRRGEMASVQFSKLCRAAQLSGSPAAPLQTPEIDLLFMTRASSTRRTLAFHDFVDVVVNGLAAKALGAQTNASMRPAERALRMAELLARARQGPPV